METKIGAEAGQKLVLDNPRDLFEHYFFVKPARAR